MVVRAFIHWMQAASVEQRTSAASALARAWLQSDLSASERDDAEAALSVLLDDPAPSVRRILAETLAPSHDAPRHVILGLASDQPDIAEIVLRHSPILLDIELIDFVATREDRYQIAVAERAPVRSCLASAIAEVADAPGCLALIENPRAELTNASMRRMAERVGDDPRVREALLARADLPAPVRQLLVARLGNLLSGLVTERSWMRPERASRVVREACDRATVDIATGTTGPDLRPLVEQLRQSAQLTTALMLRMLCAGNLAFFETALSVLSGVPQGRVHALIAEGRLSGLRAVYQKAGLPNATLMAFSIALEVFREMDFDGEGGDIHPFSRRMIERVLERSDDFAPAERDQLVLLLRRLGSEAARDAAREFIEAMIAA